MTQDGFTVNQGKAKDAMGDQWEALLWLVNGAIEQGCLIEQGHIMITGAVGHIVPGKLASMRGTGVSLEKFPGP